MNAKKIAKREREEGNSWLKRGKIGQKIRSQLLILSIYVYLAEHGSFKMTCDLLNDWKAWNQRTEKQGNQKLEHTDSVS